MSDRFFIDTNVLIYAYDLDAGAKHLKAASIVKTCWEQRNGLISTQVLQEFYVNVTRKIPMPVPLAKARGVLNTYEAWPIIVNELSDVLFASELQERYQLSFWDALIVAAAHKGRATVLLTEDLNSGQIIAGVAIQNPFL
ncbi:PilT domain-containing protein [Nitrosococcus halophilus Nc 4]|uniref:PilT domain-containing protein n=1 Tax=Nitrosococcus halophilus (strain Nc4) TaxID=472759 RepID=D5C387_NITHN|nr:PIN domain-containing protein [Nitrosococcus halophilus]ADE14979.1 PilT domain-containing protein [Nitrosococcus halophilus Nc 4]